MTKMAMRSSCLVLTMIFIAKIALGKIGGGADIDGIPPADIPTPKITFPPITISPIAISTGSPTKIPTISPSSTNPTISPTKYPTHDPTTWKPTINGETRPPTKTPTISATKNPSITPTKIPSISPTTTKPTSTPNVEIIPNGPILAANNNNNNDKNGNGINDTLEFMSAPAIPIEAICFIIILTLLIAMIYNLYIKPDGEHKQIVRSIKIPVLLTFVSNILGVICLIIITVMIATAKTWDRKTYNIALIPYYGLATTYSFGKFCLETFFVFRAYNAFKNSVFQISMVTVYILCVWMVLMSIAWCYMFMVDTFQYQFIAYYGYLIVTGFEILFVVILLYIFTKRLTKLLLQQKTERSIELSSSNNKSMTSSSPNISSLQSVQSIPSMSPPSSIKGDDVEIVNYDGMDNNDNGHNRDKSKMSKFLGLKRSNISQEFSTSDIKSVQSKLTEKQTKLIFLITRCIILSGVSLITTTIFSIVLFYFEIFGMHIFIVYALWTIDMATNCICLYLNFIFSTNIYKKCCKLYHNSCQNMFEYCAARKILKDHLDQMEQQQSL